MSLPLRPMLAVEGVEHVEAAIRGEPNLLQFPCIAQVKYDGFRCIINRGTPSTRTLNPIPNRYVRHALESVFGQTHHTHRRKFVDAPDHPMHGFDGELIALNVETMAEEPLHVSQSRFNSFDGSPRFVYQVFDDFSTYDKPYTEREINLKSRLERIGNHVLRATESRICERVEDILEFEESVLAQGLEGIILRKPDAKYKFGRSTLREFALIKIKRFSDSEATIIGFVEKMTNGNEAETDARGYTKRASCKENLIPAGTLGALKLRWDETGAEFELGTGWDARTASEIWKKRKDFMFRKVNFQYKGIGPNGKPLIPSFEGVRYDV